MEELLRQYGYWMVFLGTVFEGDATVVTASFLAHRGYLNLMVVCAVADVATILASLFLYEMARQKGTKWLGSRVASPRFQKVLGWVRSRGAVLLFFSRFLFGLRAAIALSCGLVGTPRFQFYSINVAGATLWIAVMASTGYLGGHLFTRLFDDVIRHEWTAAAILCLTVIAFKLWRDRRLANQACKLSADS